MMKETYQLVYIRQDGTVFDHFVNGEVELRESINRNLLLLGHTLIEILRVHNVHKP